jgi:putative DNA primase/helicase
MLDAALRYAARDICVLPLYEIKDGLCACGVEGCKSPGKHPRNDNGLTGASKDEAQIRNWWQRWPSANIGLATGDQFWVLDIDPRHGGNDSVMEMVHQHGCMPETVMVDTGGGGRHYYFQVNGVPIGNATGILPGVDIKSSGGYVVAAPSNHVSGNRYAVAHGSSKDLAEAPAWLLAMVTTKPAAANKPFNTAAALKGVPEGQRDDTLFKLACKLRHADVPYDVALAMVSQTASTCTPPFSHDQAKDKVASAYGRYEPGSSLAAKNYQLIQQWLQTDSPAGIHLTDTGNAKIFAMQHGQDVKFCKQIGWFIWDGRRWVRDDTGAISGLAKQMVLDCYSSLAGVADQDFREKVFKHLVKSESAKGIAAMLTLAESEPGISIGVGQLDQDLFSFNVLNGTINLRTGELQEHRRGDLLTRLAPVDYDPQAQCPRFEQFLVEIFQGNQELIRFVRQYLGYCLTGSTQEQCFTIFYGCGANGKSTLCKTIQRIMGDYASQSPIETFLVKYGGGIPNDIARLHSARTVFAAESEDGQRLAESLVKQLTGGDLISARFLHHEFFEFEPRFKLILSTNHKPTIRGTDQAIWRRIRLVPFNVAFTPEKQDKGLLEALWQERDGIYAWIVRGLQDLLWFRQLQLAHFGTLIWPTLTS